MPADIYVIKTYQDHHRGICIYNSTGIPAYIYIAPVAAVAAGAQIPNKRFSLSAFVPHLLLFVR